MSLARRHRDPHAGDFSESPAPSLLGVPEFRTQRSAARARRRARRLRFGRLLVAGCCFAAGVLTGYWLARARSPHSAPNPPPPGLDTQAERAVVSVRTLIR